MCTVVGFAEAMQSRKKEGGPGNLVEIMTFMERAVRQASDTTYPARDNDKKQQQQQQQQNPERFKRQSMNAAVSVVENNPLQPAVYFFVKSFNAI